MLLIGAFKFTAGVTSFGLTDWTRRPSRPGGMPVF
jgi:hypothetical protein